LRSAVTSSRANQAKRDTTIQLLLKIPHPNFEQQVGSVWNSARRAGIAPRLADSHFDTLGAPPAGSQQSTTIYLVLNDRDAELQ
jgi:hypothetical protein